MALENPPVETDVTLILPDREMLPGRVDVCSDTTLDIALLAAPGTPLPVWRKANVFVEWVMAKGVCRMAGSMRPLNRAPLHTDQVGVWDVVRFEVGGAPQLLQRREYIRTDYVAAVHVLLDRPGAVAVACETANLSGGGMLIRGFEGAVEGDVLHFQIPPFDGGDMPIHGRCRVVRAAKDGALGTRFTSIDEGDRDRLVAFAYRRELAERGRRLAA
jgi:hypothetical protein